MADAWLKKERELLMQRLVSVTVQSLILSVIVMLVLTAALYYLLVVLEPGERFLLMLMVALLLVGPVITFFLVSRIRRILWRRAIHGQIRRLRAVRFLSHYAAALDPDQLRSIPSRAQQALAQEAEGRLPPESDYVAALESLLLLDLVEHGPPVPEATSVPTDSGDVRPRSRQRRGKSTRSESA